MVEEFDFPIEEGTETTTFGDSLVRAAQALAQTHVGKAEGAVDDIYQLHMHSWERQPHDDKYPHRKIWKLPDGQYWVEDQAEAGHEVRRFHPLEGLNLEAYLQRIQK